jgi:hypothetical protein
VSDPHPPLPNHDLTANLIVGVVSGLRQLIERCDDVLVTVPPEHPVHGVVAEARWLTAEAYALFHVEPA